MPKQSKKNEEFELLIAFCSSAKVHMFVQKVLPRRAQKMEQDAASTLQHFMRKDLGLEKHCTQQAPLRPCLSPCDRPSYHNAHHAYDALAISASKNGVADSRFVARRSWPTHPPPSLYASQRTYRLLVAREHTSPSRLDVCATSFSQQGRQNMCRAHN